MQRFESWEEIEKTIEGGPTEAEWKLKAAVEAGKPCQCGPDGITPPEPENWSRLPSDRHIRADVLRFLVLDRKQQHITEVGIQLTGAYVSGVVTLFDCKIPHNFMLSACCFEFPIVAARSSWGADFRLNYCRVPSLAASLSEFKGQVSFDNAHIGFGQGFALDLSGSKVGNTVFLNNARLLQSAILNKMQISGMLICTGTQFLGSSPFALTLQNTTINTAFIFNGGARSGGLLHLPSAHLGDLSDDVSCWPSNGGIILDGCTYDRIIGQNCATNASTRLQWLANGETAKHPFFPQPYKQLAKVLHDMGHEADAREVFYVLEKKLGKERRKALRKEIETLRDTSPSLGRRIAKHMLLGADHAIDWLQRVTVGYGRKPFRSIGVLAGLILTFWMLTVAAWHTGGFAPNSSIVLTSSDWATYDTRSTRPAPRNPADHWSETTIPGRDWESFSAIAYAADVVVPIIDFGQTDAWAPSTTRGPAGVILWWARWVFTLAGWIVTALGAAALTGIIRRE
ncbi:hypothetical protein [Phaeobacter piscinae]|uniref:hypothetical protein n=1 Tax=Phaeobacter piscinae TaxID=1580596 RepID=UPI000B0C225D|nr:hypothetical protein [Phaeobacter piscinae]UTS79580.1 hypothetical protein OL67_000627 [Phaeobacter piscinae]